MTALLTPETALAMALTNDKSIASRESNAPSTNERADATAAALIERLSLLGFEVRRKEGARAFGCVCTYEQGDSLCPVHPTCKTCGCVTCECAKGGGQSALEIIARDRDEWKERANKFEAHVEILETRAEADLLNAEAAIARATQAEAQAAAMQACMMKYFGHYIAVDEETAGMLRGTGDAGRTLLAELEALRALEVTVRKARISEWQGKTDAEVDAAYLRCCEALAAVDAARKGET